MSKNKNRNETHAEEDPRCCQEGEVQEKNHGDLVNEYAQGAHYAQNWYGHVKRLLRCCQNMVNNSREVIDFHPPSMPQAIRFHRSRARPKAIAARPSNRNEMPTSERLKTPSRDMEKPKYRRIVVPTTAITRSPNVLTLHM